MRAWLRCWQATARTGNVAFCAVLQGLEFEITVEHDVLELVSAQIACASLRPAALALIVRHGAAARVRAAGRGVDGRTRWRQRVGRRRAAVVGERRQHRVAVCEIEAGAALVRRQVRAAQSDRAGRELAAAVAAGVRGEDAVGDPQALDRAVRADLDRAAAAGRGNVFGYGDEAQVEEAVGLDRAARTCRISR